MVDIQRRRFGRNEIWWLAEGEGAHGVEPRTHESVVASLAGRFAFAEETYERKGLRSPQLGALHAILAHRSMETGEPITIVMPTGTGKTETMLAAFAHTPARILVIVPSDALRTQIATKFVTFGVLPTVGALTGDFYCPVVGVVRSRLATAQQADELIDECSVLVATAAAIAGSSDEALTRLVIRCDGLFVDEAHHVAARTWRDIAEKFSSKLIVQFTATPFREDGKHLGGRIPYAYPLRLAQERGYFAPINYHSILDLGHADDTLAAAALNQLRQDLQSGLDHVLMARVQTIPRAEEVLSIYQRVAADLRPLRLDSKLSARAQAAAHKALRDRETRVIVCVDMLGEGFDLPALKVAAVHDPHKSLAVTLQFIGRFARVGGDELGDASVFVPRIATDLDDCLRKLYGEDADWNGLIRDLTQAEVDRERARSQFEEGFGVIPYEVAMQSLQPKMSTVIYYSEDLQWNPDAIYDLVDGEHLLTKKVAVNAAEYVAWFVTAEQAPVPWGQFSNFGETVHHLYLLHAQPDKGLLYINSSNNDSVHQDLAAAVGGPGVQLIRGDVVYRVLHPIARRVPTNVGLLDAVSRNRRFSMHVGADVLEGFGPNAAQKSKTNIFAHGYANGSWVSYGASRKGRIWSYKVANNLLDWVTWAEAVGAVVTDETITVRSVMEEFIIPLEATARPPLVPLGIEWPYQLLASTSEARQVEFETESTPLLDVDLVLTNWSDSDPIRFDVRTEEWSLPYQLTFGEDGPVYGAIGSDAVLHAPGGPIGLAAFMTANGMNVFFEQEATLSPDGYLLQPDRSRPRFDAAALDAIAWEGTDIHKESQGQDRDADSVQYRAIEHLASVVDWEIILDDDGKGEVADVVMLRRDDRVLRIMLVHCKFSGGDQPGARLGDLYEVCGQAVKSHKARSEVDLVLRKLLRREAKRSQQGRTGFVRGTAAELLSILQEVRLFDVDVTVVVAQPGLSAQRLTVPLSELLGCTQLFLSETYNSRFRVLCSA